MQMIHRRVYCSKILITARLLESPKEELESFFGLNTVFQAKKWILSQNCTDSIVLKLPAKLRRINCIGSLCSIVLGHCPLPPLLCPPCVVFVFVLWISEHVTRSKVWIPNSMNAHWMPLNGRFRRSLPSLLRCIRKLANLIQWTWRQSQFKTALNAFWPEGIPFSLTVSHVYNKRTKKFWTSNAFNGIHFMFATAKIFTKQLHLGQNLFRFLELVTRSGCIKVIEVTGLSKLQKSIWVVVQRAGNSVHKLVDLKVNFF